MKFFRTKAQRKVLQWYWRENKPFSVNTLIKEKVLHNRILGKIALWDMERKGQIIRPIYGDARYVGTTDCQEEWERLAVAHSMDNYAVVCYYYNRYEKAELIPILEGMIEEYMRSGA